MTDPAFDLRVLESGGYAIGSSRPLNRRLHPVGVGLDYPGVPPLISVISLCPRVPPPPLLKATDTPERNARLLSFWFISSTEAKFRGSKCWTFRNPKVFRDIRQSAHFDLLVKASAVFIELEIAPAAWCAFSCDVWSNFGKEKKAPPASWVFGPKRIEERQGWFRGEAGDYAGGRVVITDRARKLLQLQSWMRSCVSRECPDDTRLREIVHHYFPGRLYEDLVSQVKQESMMIQRELDSKAQSGGWVW